MGRGRYHNIRTISSPFARDCTPTGRQIGGGKKGCGDKKGRAEETATAGAEGPAGDDKAQAAAKARAAKRAPAEATRSIAGRQRGSRQREEDEDYHNDRRHRGSQDGGYGRPAGSTVRVAHARKTAKDKPREHRRGPT